MQKIFISMLKNVDMFSRTNTQNAAFAHTKVQLQSRIYITMFIRRTFKALKSAFFLLFH